MTKQNVKIPGPLFDLFQFRTDIEQDLRELGDLEQQYDMAELDCLDTKGHRANAGGVEGNSDSSSEPAESENITPLEHTAGGLLDILGNKKELIRAKRQNILELYQRRIEVSLTE